MDFRDFALWVRQARKNSLVRKAEAYAATILPHLKQGAIRTELERVKWQIYEIDYEEEINEADRKAQERRLQDSERRKRKKEVKNG